MRERRLAGVLTVAVAMSLGGSLQAQQNPRARLQPKGLGVSPTFEGWYPNPDGTYTLSWGFINRNTEEILTIPVGPDNFVGPGAEDQGQATYFTAGRSYGIFTVTVPADFGPDDRVTWTLDVNGERYGIPGGLIDSYETDNLHAHAIDRYPPVVVLETDGAESRGPNGARIGPLMTKVGQPIELTASSWDQQGHAVTLRWYKYRGPGDVTFTEAETPIPEGTTEAATSASFSQAGDYVVYVRADHSDVRVTAAGLEQCCWTNGYISVTVSR